MAFGLWCPRDLAGIRPMPSLGGLVCHDAGDQEKHAGHQRSALDRFPTASPLLFLLPLDLGLLWRHDWPHGDDKLVGMDERFCSVDCADEDDPHAKEYLCHPVHVVFLGLVSFPR